MNPIQPAAAGQSQAPASPQGGMTVCITAQTDGTFMVYPKESDDTGQQVADLDAALDAARTMLGGAAPEGQSDTAEADALFNQGFDQARGTPLNGR